MVNDLVPFVGALVGSALGAYLAVRSLLPHRAARTLHILPTGSDGDVLTQNLPPQWSGAGAAPATAPLTPQPAQPKRAPVYGTPEKAALHERRHSSPLHDRLSDDGGTLTRLGGRDA